LVLDNIHFHHEEQIMTTAGSTISTSAAADVEAVQTGFQAVAAGDMAGFAAMFHPDATWNHRNDDRLGGTKAGVDAIVGFLGESMELTAGTLRPVPEIYMPDGAGRVAAPTSADSTTPRSCCSDWSRVAFAQWTSSSATQPQ